MMKEKIKECFDRLQALDITPTLGNMEILVQTLYDLRQVYQKLEEMETDGTEADPGGRDDD